MRKKTRVLLALTMVWAGQSARGAAVAFFTDSGFGVMSPGNADTWDGNKTQSSVIFEVTIDYTADVAAATDPFSLLELGGDAIGSGIAIDGSQILFVSGGNGLATTSVVSGAHGLVVGDSAIQILASIEFGAGTGNNELMSLYVDGSLIGTVDGPTRNDWAGANSSNLGTSDGFNIFRYVPTLNPAGGGNAVYAGAFPDDSTSITFAAYELGVGDNTVQNILVPEPGSLMLVSFGCFALCWRRTVRR